MDFRGGDKPDDELKKYDDPQVVGFSEALKELVQAISIVHFQGKTPKDFDAVEGSTRATWALQTSIFLSSYMFSLKTLQLGT